ncbi:MAG: ATP-binding cassette domain-containing protein [Actinobacteria bacterium]|nr:ATP-binding cassette domain-containing protein [Actinomycetota bacterium]
MTEAASQGGTRDAVAELVNASRTYETPAGLVTALAPTHLQVHAGEVIGLAGPSGSGKTTMLHLLGLLLRPTTGDVLLHGKPTAAARERARGDLRRRLVTTRRW